MQGGRGAEKMQCRNMAMDWKKKLALDALVAAIVWAIGAVLFLKFEDKEDLIALYLVPLLSGWTFGVYWESFARRPEFWKGVRIAVLALLPVAFSVQFTGKRGAGWTVLGAVAVALWWACGVLLAFAVSALSPWTRGG